MMKSAIAKASFHLQWWVVIAILFFSTAAFGGVHEPSLYLIRCLIALSLVLQAVLSVLQSDYLSDFHPSIIFPLILFFAFLILTSVQYFLGPTLLQGSVVGTVNSYATRESLFQLAAYFSFFIVCVKIVSQPKFLERLISLVVVLVFTITVLGLVQRFAGEERILWKSLLTTKTAFFGPFVNKNHFGGFLGLTFPLALGLLHYRFYRFQRDFQEDPQSKPLWLKLTALMNSGAVFLFFLVMLTLAACFFSFAKAASLVLLFCCIAYFFVSGFNRRGVPFYLVLLAILAGSFLFLQWLGDTVFTGHFRAEDFENSWTVRSHVFRQSFSLFHLFPLFGTGLGTYRFISSKTVSYLINHFSWEHVHNDYLELLTDTGIVGFCLFIAAFLALFLIAIKRSRESPSHWNRFMVRQALISIFAIAMMELVDFHLKIPALALFFVLQSAILFRLGTQYGRSSEAVILRPEAEESKSRSFASLRMTPVSFKWALALVYLALAGVLLFFSTTRFWSYRLSKAEDNRLSHLEKVVRVEPLDASGWFQLGKAYRERAKEVQGEESNILKQRAIEVLRKAVTLSPTDAHDWYYLGALEYSLGYRQESLLSLEQAVHWSPARLNYSLYLLAAYFKESDMADTLKGKANLRNKARDLYDKLQALETPPRRDEYKTWLGDYYYSKLDRLTAH